QEKQIFRDQLGEARVQLQQQSEYCNQMGSTVCTLLWGATRNVEAVKNILSGREAERFFNVAGQTLDTFVKSLDADIRPEQHDETQFVLALAGIITTQNRYHNVYTNHQPISQILYTSGSTCNMRIINYQIHAAKYQHKLWSQMSAPLQAPTPEHVELAMQLALEGKNTAKIQLQAACDSIYNNARAVASVVSVRCVLQMK
ncbi:Heat shock factor 2-binding protein, partial [Acipenser ruthenus]